jgi:hypothetical protein
MYPFALHGLVPGNIYLESLEYRFVCPFAFKLEAQLIFHEPGHEERTGIVQLNKILTQRA